MRRPFRSELQTLAHSAFGGGVRVDFRGKFGFVHLDDPQSEVRQKRLSSFVPHLFFDPQCQCCRPFLNNGALMVCDGESIVGMRPLGDGAFETVLLAPPTEPN